MEKEEKKKWTDMPPRDAAAQYIDHIYNYYYKDYDRESVRYQNIFNYFTLMVIFLGFSTSVLATIQKQEIIKYYSEYISWILIVLPFLSSLIVTVITQFRIREKFILREDARLKASDLLTKARIRFAAANEEKDYTLLHEWLSDEIYQLQLNQKTGFFGQEPSSGNKGNPVLRGTDDGKQSS
jgi:hypothetical protein